MLGRDNAEASFTKTGTEGSMGLAKATACDKPVTSVSLTIQLSVCTAWDTSMGTGIICMAENLSGLTHNH